MVVVVYGFSVAQVFAVLFSEPARNLASYLNRQLAECYVARGTGVGRRTARWGGKEDRPL